MRVVGALLFAGVASADSLHGDMYLRLLSSSNSSNSSNSNSTPAQADPSLADRADAKVATFANNDDKVALDTANTALTQKKAQIPAACKVNTTRLLEEVADLQDGGEAFSLNLVLQRELSACAKEDVATNFKTETTYSASPVLQARRRRLAALTADQTKLKNAIEVGMAVAVEDISCDAAYVPAFYSTIRKCMPHWDDATVKYKTAAASTNCPSKVGDNIDSAKFTGCHTFSWNAAYTTVSQDSSLTMTLPSVIAAEAKAVVAAAEKGPLNPTKMKDSIAARAKSILVAMVADQPALFPAGYQSSKLDSLTFTSAVTKKTTGGSTGASSAFTLGTLTVASILSLFFM